MARHKVTPYQLRSKDGRAVLDFRTTEGRTKVALGVPYDPERSSPAECRTAREAAEDRYRELTSGRVVTEHARIRTPLTFNELYALYLERWAPVDGADENARRRLQTAFVVRRVYGATVMEWASDEAVRPDGSKRWRGDDRTPLQRIAADDGPAGFLAWRLTRVRRKTMRKEKSNLAQWLGWAKAHGYLATVPPCELPSGTGTDALSNGRGRHIPLTPLLAAQLVAVMPEWSARVSRAPAGSGGRFLVRPFFDLMNETGLREATLERLEVPRNWRPGQTTLALTDADDKAKYGRAFPLTRRAVGVLAKYAPATGHVFGHHDRRRFVKLAAAVVFADEPETARLFGGYHLRHHVGTFLANRAGTNLAAASYVLGHKDLSTTSVYVHADEDGARALLASTEAERGRAARKAAAWNAKRARNSVPLRSRTPGPSSKNPTKQVGASGFEPPTPRPPAQTCRKKPRETRGQCTKNTSRNATKSKAPPEFGPDSVPARGVSRPAVRHTVWSRPEALHRAGAVLV